VLVKLITHSPAETKKAGEKLGRFCHSNLSDLNQALVISLEGALGGGKTTFLKGLAKIFQIQNVLSPTFIIYRSYPLKDAPFKEFYHFDFYRLEKPKELKVLGWEEKIADPRKIIVVEWGDKFPSLLPVQKIKIEFKFKKLKEREIVFHFPSSWSPKWSTSL
jgi:tRNA threonylcarbamoyladenosine biosynthesis protein TsaE